MNDVASLAVSRELYESSGWRNTTYWWRLHKPSGRNKLYTFHEMDADNYRFRNSPEAGRFREENEFFPAYDLGYLLRKGYLFNLGIWVLNGKREWRAVNAGRRKIEVFADAPEDAAAKLAIDLFKQGILTKDGDRE